MDASQLPKGASAETSQRNVNLPGIYEHPEAKVRTITQPGSEGIVQADALVQVGYQRVGDVPSRTELALAQKKQLARDMAEEKAAKIREEAELKKLSDDIIAEAQAEADALKAEAAESSDEAAPSEPVAPEVAPATEVAAELAPAVSTK